MLCVEVWSGCCVHTQGTHIGEKSVVCGVGVVCTHKVHTQREGRVLRAEGVLCAHTRYTHRREKCCVWSMCCVHTQRREEC